MTVNPPSFVDRFVKSPVGVWLRHRLDNWKPWVVVIGFGLICVVVWTLTIFQQQSRDEQRHDTEIIANADGQYVQCVKSIPVLAKINRFFVGAQIVDNALIQNSQENLKATPKSSPLYTVRKRNLERLQRAEKAARQVKFTVPTRDGCATLRDQLLQSHDLAPAAIPPSGPTGVAKTVTTA